MKKEENYLKWSFLSQQIINYHFQIFVIFLKMFSWRKIVSAHEDVFFNFRKYYLDFFLFLETVPIQTKRTDLLVHRHYYRRQIRQVVVIYPTTWAMITALSTHETLERNGPHNGAMSTRWPNVTPLAPTAPVKQRSEGRHRTASRWSVRTILIGPRFWLYRCEGWCLRTPITAYNHWK